MGRAPCCDKENVKRGPWSPEEDAKLKAYIEEHGTCGNWIALPRKIGLKRCGKSCRLRWLNYLRPNIKHGDFTDEEDQIICSLYISIGSRWSIIAAQLPGRTDNDIKNYWNTRLKKKLLGRRNEPPQSQNLCSNQIPSTKEVDIKGVIHEAPNSQTLSTSALERMQLYMQLLGLYNNPFFYSNPSLWPKYHPLGDQRIHQPMDASLLQQVNYSSQSSIQSLTAKTDMTIHEEIDCSSLRFHSPVSRELQDNLSYVGHVQEQQLDELDCYKEICKEKESANWWSSNNGFDDSTIFTFHTDSMVQEYALQYDL